MLLDFHGVPRIASRGTLLQMTGGLRLIVRSGLQSAMAVAGLSQAGYFVLSLLVVLCYNSIHMGIEYLFLVVKCYLLFACRLSLISCSGDGVGDFDSTTQRLPAAGKREGLWRSVQFDARWWCYGCWCSHFQCGLDEVRQRLGHVNRLDRRLQYRNRDT
jgi:hypothetical protein